MGYEDQNVTELRKLAIDRDVRWKDQDGKPLRKGDLVEALETHDAAGAHDAAEAPQDDVATAPTEPPTVEADSDGEPPPDDETMAEAAYREPEVWGRLTKDVRFHDRGVIHKIAKGTVLSNRTHDMKKLRPQLEAQGMPVEECGEPERATDAYGRPRGRAYGAPLPATRDQRSFDEQVNPQAYLHRDDDGQRVRLEADGKRTAIPDEPSASTITTPDGRRATTRTDPQTGKPSPGALTNG